MVAENNSLVYRSTVARDLDPDIVPIPGKVGTKLKLINIECTLLLARLHPVLEPHAAGLLVVPAARVSGNTISGIIILYPVS